MSCLTHRLACSWAADSVRFSVWAVVAALALVAFAPAEATATILRRFDLAGLSREAHVVVRGRVLSQEARWNEDHTRIYRYSEVEVLERVKGEAIPGRITVKQIGGTVGETTMTVAATAELSVGEELLLFLRTDGRYHYLVGMQQGCYGVYRDARGAWVTRTPRRRRTVTRATSVAGPARTTAPRPAVPARALERPAPADRTALDRFLDEVRRHERATPSPVGR